MTYSKSGMSEEGKKWFDGYDPTFPLNHWKTEPSIGSFTLKMRADGVYLLQRIFPNGGYVREFQPSEAEILCDVLFGTFVWHRCYRKPESKA